MIRIYESIVRLTDVIIEHEGAFGVRFGEVDFSFEARGKCGNDIAYPRKSIERWTKEDAVEVLEGLREYLKEELKVKDENECI